ncbi:MAG TPA: flagellar basal body protein [Kofleriaceae bacterium]|nr:flagellar basal body protein [Kofleriaceae bacterium]
MTSIFGPVDTLSNALAFHRERQNVLAGNLSNLETPGYRPLDLRRTIEPTGAALETTDPRHLGGSPGGMNTEVFDDGGALAGPDGNAVSLEREQSKIDANRVRYNTSAELVTRRLALLRYAAGDGVG